MLVICEHDYVKRERRSITSWIDHYTANCCAAFPPPRDVVKIHVDTINESE